MGRRKRRQKEKVYSNAKDKIVKEDRISELPDDILVRILSSLTVKEVLLTSILSRRWRYLWTHITCINFTNIPDMHGVKIFKLVKKFCSSLQSPRIERFIIEHSNEMYSSFSYSVDILIKYAMKKEVEHLKVITRSTPDVLHRRAGYELYQSNLFSGFEQLRSLHLENVKLRWNALEPFFGERSSLEELSIQSSDGFGFTVLKVGGPLCNLKSLKLFYNECLIGLEICAPKLSDFQIHGCSKRINLHIDNVPLLSQVYIGGFGDCLTQTMSQLSTQLSQIHTLELCLKDHREACNCESGCCAWGNMDFSPFSKLSSLRVLTVRRFLRADESLLFLLSFLEACPLVEKFKVEIEFQDEHEQATSTLEETNLAIRPHQHLKVLEVVNFVHHPKLIEFVKYIYRAAVRIEKVVIDPAGRSSSPNLGRILSTMEFEELFQELVRTGIFRKVEFVMVD